MSDLTNPRGRPRKDVQLRAETPRRLQVRLNGNQNGFVLRRVAAGDGATKVRICTRALEVYFKVLEKRIILEDPTGKKPREVLNIV